MERPTRRQMLASLGTGAAWLTLPGGRACARTGRHGVTELAMKIRRTPRREILAWSADVIRRGVDRETFLAAVYLAGVQDISPWPCGNHLHAVMVLDSVQKVAAGASRQNAWMATLWSLDYFKQAQAADASTGDWTLWPAPKAAATLKPAAARKELQRALRDWDHDRADRAVTALVRRMGRRQLFELLWPWAGRCGGSLAHKVIYAAQTHRALAWLGDGQAESAVRSMVMGLLFRGGRLTSASDRAQGLIDRIPDDWQSGKEEPGKSLDLLRGMRKASFSEAQDLVLAAFGDGLGPQTVFDGLRLFATELFSRRTTDDATKGGAVLPVHCVTALHGFAHAFRTTRIDRTRRLLVLQAAGWLPQLRDQAVRRVGLGAKRRGRAVPYDEQPARVSPAHPHDLFRATVDSHQYKLLAALDEEVRYAAPRWRPHLQGCADGYLPPRGSGGTAFGRRCEKLLAKLR